MTCRYYGISRQSYYTMYRRYQAEGIEGLRSRSHRPHHFPHATSTEAVGKIIHLRLHYHFGPAKIAMYLQRYHDVTVSVSGVWRILKRAGHEPAACLAALQAPTTSGGNATRNSCPGIGYRST
jgi:transposase